MVEKPQQPSQELAFQRQEEFPRNSEKTTTIAGKNAEFSVLDE